MRSVILTAALMGLVGLAATAQAELLLSDNFNDNSLDATKWEMFNVFSLSSWAETNQRMELTNRPWLMTAQNFDPGSYSEGLTIVGQFMWHNLSSNTLDSTLRDNIGFHTRAADYYTGTPDVYASPWGSPAFGIRFRTGDGGVYAGRTTNLRIDYVNYGVSYLTVGANISTGTITWESDTLYDFVIFDGGGLGTTTDRNLSFTVTKHDDPSVTASVTAYVTKDDRPTPATQSRVVFNNSQYTAPNSHTMFMDNIVMYTGEVPEPGTFVLLAAGLAGLLAYAWRKRR